MRVYLNLINKSGWSTRDLAKFVRAGIKASGVYPGSRRKPWVVTVKEHLDIQCDGAAVLQYEGEKIVDKAITLILPPVVWCAGLTLPAPLFRDLAQTLIHEIDHCRGLDHKEMANLENLDISWSNKLYIRVT